MHFTKNTLAAALAGATSIWASSGLLSANAETASETVLPPVNVTASPIKNHAIFELPSQVDRLASEDKMAIESGSLGEMVESIPGVNNQSSGAQSGKPVIRGMSGNRVKVLSNGQNTDYQAYGTRHNPNTEAFLAERIEVVRGTQSVLYGSEALAGVVNVIQAQIPYGEALKGELASEYNSNNQEKFLGLKLGAGSDRFGIIAGFALREGDDFTVPKVSSAKGSSPSSAVGDKPLFVGEVPNTNFENRSGNIGFGYQGDWGQVELRHTQWNSKQNYLGVEAEDATSAYEAVATGQKLQNDETQLSAEFFVNDGWMIKPTWSHTRNQREASHDLPFETMSSEKGTDEYLNLLVRRDDFKLAIDHPQWGIFKGELGFEATEKSQTLISGHLTPTATESKRAIYLFEEANIDQWLVQLGVRYDLHQVQAPLDGHNEHFVDEMGVFDASSNSRDFGVWSGSLGGTYSFNSQWSLAGNVARGFRAPTIFELYAGGEHGGVQAFQIGNPDLKAETAINTDISLRWKTQQTQMVATVYQNWIDNYIYLANTGLYRGTEGSPNEGEVVASNTPGAVIEMQAQQSNAVIQGLEWQLTHQWNSRWSGDMALELIDGQDSKNNQDLALMPANNVRFNLNLTPQDAMCLQKQRWRLGVKLVDSKNAAGTYEPFSQFDDLPFGRASTEAYALWNLAYQGQIKLNQQTLQLGATIENLFDTDYVDFMDTYKGVTLGQGRNWKLWMKLNF